MLGYTHFVSESNKMKAAEVLVKVQENLNQTTLPDGSELSDQDADAIERHLRHIFLEAFCLLELDEIEQFTQNILTELKVETPRDESPRDESYTNLHQKFVYQFKKPLFKPTHYGLVTIIEEYAALRSILKIDQFFLKPERFISALVRYLIQNLDVYSVQHNAALAQKHNHYVFQFLLGCFNSNIINAYLCLLFFNYRDSNFFLYALYQLALSLLSFIGILILGVSMVVAGTAMGVALILDILIKFFIHSLRNWIERPLVNALTNRQYDTEIEYDAVIKLGQSHLDLDTKYLLLVQENLLKSESDALELGYQILQAKIQNQAEEGLDESVAKKGICRNVISARGLTHFNYVLKSLYKMLFRSFPSNQSDIYTVFLRFLGLLAAIPLILCVSLPLLLLDFASNTLMAFSLVMSVASFVLLGVVVIIENVLAALPLYLYDALFNQTFVPIDNTEIIKKACASALTLKASVSDRWLFAKPIQLIKTQIEAEMWVPKCEMR